MASIEKIKDYVSREPAKITGDTSGNFTISPLGFPNVNVSDYGEPSGKIPTLFVPTVSVVPSDPLPDAIYVHKSVFSFPLINNSGDGFSIDGTLRHDTEGYKFTTDYAEYTAGVTVKIAVGNSYQAYLEFNGTYEVMTGNYISSPSSMSLPDEGIPITVAFIPDDNHNILKFTGCGDDNGIYKIYLSTSGSIISYKWLYISALPADCLSELTFDGTENDNVEGGVYDDSGTLNHYRKAESRKEVGDYLRSRLGDAISCGKFYGKEYPTVANGLLIKWFLGDSPIAISSGRRILLIDSFGKIPSDTSSEGCLISNINSAGIIEKNEYERQMNAMAIDSSGTDTPVPDYPEDEFTGSYNNNITISEPNLPWIGGRDTIVINTDLSNIASTPPRKTYIHLTTPLTVIDGEKREFNIALPITAQPSSGTSSDRLKGYYSYIRQPRAYILTGKQYSLSDNRINGDTVSVSDGHFRFYTMSTLTSDDVGSIAFSIINTGECNKKYTYEGSATVSSVSGTFYVDSSENTEYDALTFASALTGVKAKSKVIIDGTIEIMASGKVSSVSGSTVTVLIGRAVTSSDIVKIGADTITLTSTGNDYEYTFSQDGHSIGEIIEFSVRTAYQGYYTVKSISSDGMLVKFETLIDPSMENIKLYTTSVYVDGTFPYSTTSRKWSMLTKDTNCMMDIRYLKNSSDDKEGLTERAAGDSTVFISTADNSDTVFNDPDAVIATVYPTSTGTFPWRLNGRKRIRHLGLTSGADVDWLDSSGETSVAKMMFDVNSDIFAKLSEPLGISGASADKIRINYDLTPSASVLGELTRVALASSIDTDYSGDDDTMSVTSQAKLAYWDLIGDFKISRVGYKYSGTSYSVKDTSWPPDGLLPVTNDATTLKKINEWLIKLIHTPDYTLGVYPNGDERNIEYAGWDKITKIPGFDIFYDTDMSSVLSGASGNIMYVSSKTQGGTTQKTEETFTGDSLSGIENSSPFNYAANHSIIRAAYGSSPSDLTINRACSMVNGFLTINEINRGLRGISYLENIADEFKNGAMDPFCPMSHVFSTDGTAFPDLPSSDVKAMVSSSDSEIRKAILGFPDKVVAFSASATKDLTDGSNNPLELISMYSDDTNDTSGIIGYSKSLLPMYSQKMPMHMYDSERVINSEKSAFITAHEITIYERRLPSGYLTSHEYNDLASNSGITGGDGTAIDYNMTYQLVSDDAVASTPVSFTSPLESASATYMSERFSGSYTRIHISAVFSAYKGRWLIKDYYQYPTNYLTPMYGADTLGAMEKSYTVGISNPKSAANRVDKSLGMVDGKFVSSVYSAVCETQPLWVMPCGFGTGYKEGMRMPYEAQPALEINKGCIPFLMNSFPYGSTGALRTETAYNATARGTGNTISFLIKENDVERVFTITLSGGEFSYRVTDRVEGISYSVILVKSPGSPLDRPNEITDAVDSSKKYKVYYNYLNSVQSLLWITTGYDGDGIDASSYYFYDAVTYPSGWRLPTQGEVQGLLQKIQQENNLSGEYAALPYILTPSAWSETGTTVATFGKYLSLNPNGYAEIDLGSARRFNNLYSSIKIPMTAYGNQKAGDYAPEVNFWSVKWHCRPARSVYPGSDIPTMGSRTGGTISSPTLGMFDDSNVEDATLVLSSENNEFLTTESGDLLLGG